MGLCDELESKLRKSREDSEKLMEAVVRRCSRWKNRIGEAYPATGSEYSIEVN